MDLLLLLFSDRMRNDPLRVSHEGLAAADRYESDRYFDMIGPAVDLGAITSDEAFERLRLFFHKAAAFGEARISPRSCLPQTGELRCHWKRREVHSGAIRLARFVKIPIEGRQRADQIGTALAPLFLRSLPRAVVRPVSAFPKGSDCLRIWVWFLGVRDDTLGFLGASTASNGRNRASGRSASHRASPSPPHRTAPPNR